MIIQLIDKNPEMVKAWRKYFTESDQLKIICGDALEIPTDCLATPGNSFGFMDGGFDLAISQKFGWHIQDCVQEAIKKRYWGELFVGSMVLVPTIFQVIDNSNIFAYHSIDYVLYAPTMRIPMQLPTNCMNIYLASKVIFQFAKENNLPNVPTKINTITIPGLGTGCGQLPPEIAARQMYLAYKDFYLGEYKAPKTWQEAAKQQEDIIDTCNHIYNAICPLCHPKRCDCPKQAVCIKCGAMA